MRLAVTQHSVSSERALSRSFASAFPPAVSQVSVWMADVGVSRARFMVGRRAVSLFGLFFPSLGGAAGTSLFGTAGGGISLMKVRRRCIGSESWAR